MKPTFIHIGPQRCGTTTLYSVLKHLQCVPIDVKEIQFFDRHYDLGFQWYLSHFNKLNTSTAIGEICPSYFDSPNSMERIQQTLPEIKIICTLRDPLSRITSYYRLLRMYDQCAEGIAYAWETCAELRDCCMYSDKLHRWRSNFGKSRFMVMFFDDLIKYPQKYLEQFCSFAGVQMPAGVSLPINGPEIEPIPRFPLLNGLSANVGMMFRRKQLYKSLEYIRRIFRPFIYKIGVPTYRIEMSPSLKQRVSNYYNDEIDRLEILCGRDLSAWRSEV